ncbi:MAG: LolA family protein [Jatrophihabitans sp.]|uniref:LolA family protein n=1 Tax=Jatrophihabitans sp. TaxID=1932789 RepID=UPI003F7D8BC3
MSTSHRPLTRRLLPWSAPVIVAGAVVGVVALSSGSSSAAVPQLAGLSAQQLIAKVEQVRTVHLSGVVHEAASLGLPDLPGGASSASLSWTSFVTGSHDAKLWLDGPARQRIALTGQLSEAEVVHNGRDVWTYTSDSNTATHTTLPAAKADRRPDTTETPEDPTALAAKLLKAVDPTTDVSVDTSRYVAGRAAYTLRLAPKSSDSTVRAVTISIDGKTFVPLQVQIFSTSSATPAFTVGFSHVRFATPAASVFSYAVPKGATVSTGNPLTTERHWHGDHSPATPPDATQHAGARMTAVGDGWTTVARIPAGAASALTGGMLRDATSPYGSSGARLLHTALVNVLIEPDGTAWAGAVTPAYLASVAH